MPEYRQLTLKRELGLWSTTALVVGNVIGSAIFLVPSTMVQRVGSAEKVLLIFLFGGLLSLAGALSFAELAAALPEAGGPYVYLREAYGPFWGFTYSWTMMWVGNSGAMASLATAFFYYLANFLPALEQVFLVVPLRVGLEGGPLEISYGQLLGMGVILFLGLVNHLGVKLGGRVQVATTLAKVGLLGGIILIGLAWGQGSSSHFGESVASTGGAAGFFAALVAALWAYQGWADVSQAAAEVRQPQRNLPRALIGGTIVIMGIYLLTNLAYFYVLPPADVAASDRVAATMMERISGNFGADAVSVAAMISIFAALNGGLLTSARVPYAAARDGLFFRSFGFVHPVHRTPSVSLLAVSIWSALLVLSGRYEQLFTYVIFASWLLYGMAAAAVLVLRRRQPHLPRPYRTLGYPVVPVLFVLVAACMLISTLLESPRESLMGLGIAVAGIPFYFYWKRRAPGPTPRSE